MHYLGLNPRMSWPRWFSVKRSKEHYQSECERIAYLNHHDSLSLVHCSRWKRPFRKMKLAYVRQQRESDLSICKAQIEVARALRVICYSLPLFLCVIPYAYKAGVFDRDTTEREVVRSKITSSPQAQKTPSPVDTSQRATHGSNPWPEHNLEAPSQNRPFAYQPSFDAEQVGKLASLAHQYVLSRELVDVSGYYRGETRVEPYQRQPPGGFSFDNKLEATGAAALVTGTIITADYLSQKTAYKASLPEKKESWWKVRDAEVIEVPWWKSKKDVKTEEPWWKFKKDKKVKGSWW